ncbi:hypothetical protein Mx8p77 [Myxococcus phage Mx8]|uniref:p77 n=1 Tax=Myxococcus phage Mx8 TaxID=49964 RepID=Q94MP2_9CAUD|nr:hypothetical protein Mx8p77 [Myxococcus phage Mx8]AAK94412.1 p77 [Myxococcus phage Mx8]
MTEGQWCITKDNDDWMSAPGFDSKEEAVALAPKLLLLSSSQKFWVGRAVQAASHLGADLVSDALENHASDEGPDGCDGSNLTTEAHAELEALLDAWAKKHDVRPLWFDIEEEEEHVAPALHLFVDDDGNAYAARDLDHAKELWTADTGQPAEEAGDWQSIPDEREITIRDDEGTVTKRAGDWANEAFEPGCIGGDNY